VSTTQRNLLLLVIALVIAGVPALSALGVLPPLVPGAAWSGGDTQITEVVGQLQEGYQPWFESFFRPDELGIERYLFGLQALLGAGLVAAFVGYFVGRRNGRLGREGNERRTAMIISAVVIVVTLPLFLVQTDLGELQAFLTALQGVALGTLGFFIGYPLGKHAGEREAASAAPGVRARAV
jgi:cobalt/nickel transport protein